MVYPTIGNKRIHTRSDVKVLVGTQETADAISVMIPQCEAWRLNRQRVMHQAAGSKANASVSRPDWRANQYGVKAMRAPVTTHPASASCSRMWWLGLAVEMPYLDQYQSSSDFVHRVLHKIKVITTAAIIPIVRSGLSKLPKWPMSTPPASRIDSVTRDERGRISPCRVIHSCLVSLAREAIAFPINHTM